MPPQEVRRGNPYASPQYVDPPTARKAVLWKGVLAMGFVFALIANGGSMGIMLTLLGLVVAGPLCAAATLIAPDWRGKVFASIGVLLSVTPLPLGSITLQLVAEAAGFTLQP